MGSKLSSIVFAQEVRGAAKVRSSQKEILNAGYELDSIYWWANNLLCQTNRGFRGKISHIVRFIKKQNYILFRNEQDILGRWR